MTASRYAWAISAFVTGRPYWITVCERSKTTTGLCARARRPLGSLRLRSARATLEHAHPRIRCGDGRRRASCAASLARRSPRRWACRHCCARGDAETECWVERLSTRPRPRLIVAADQGAGIRHGQAPPNYVPPVDQGRPPH